MKGILCYVTRKLEGIFDGILMEFRMRISEDKNQTQKSMYIPRFLSSGLYGSYLASYLARRVHTQRTNNNEQQRTTTKKTENNTRHKTRGFVH